MIYALLQYLRAAVTHGKRGEHKPRNGDRIHTSVPVYLLMVLQGHREGVALLVVWHHGVRLRASAGDDEFQRAESLFCVHVF